jgi:hypothetical protein
VDVPEEEYGWLLMSQQESTGLTARRVGSREDGINVGVLAVEFAVLEAPGIDRVVLAGGQLELTFHAVAGQAYAVETGASLPVADWRVVTTLPPGKADREVTVATPISGPAGFYRLTTSWP